MKIRKRVPSGTRWAKAVEYHIIAEAGRNLSVTNPHETESVFIKIETDPENEMDQEIILSWSEIEFFAALYHKYKVKHA